MTKAEIKKKLSKRYSKNELIKVGAVIGALSLCGVSYGLYRYFSPTIKKPLGPTITLTPPPSPSMHRKSDSKRKSLTPPPSPSGRRHSHKGSTIKVEKSKD